MKLGIIGLGRIAEKVVGTTLSQMSEIELYACGSRSLERAEEFKQKFGFKKAYGSYEELAKDPEIELVYVCTPHSEHYENMKVLLKHNKNILCEKSFTLDATQAKEIVDLARQDDVFLAEAIWPRYKKISNKVTEVINSGIIGKVDFMTSNLFYPVTDKERIMSKSLGGGALLDLGVYVINYALTHFGYDIEHVESSMKLTATGVDEMETITLFFKDGKMASLSCGIRSRSDRHSVFFGENGYIVVDNVNTPGNFKVYNAEDELIDSYDDKNDITGYEFEFRECVSCIEKGLKESPMMPLEETVKVLEVMDKVRASWNN